MMKLSTMWKLVNRVGEQRSCPLAEDILQRWGYDPGSVRFSRASANFVCDFKRDGRRYFLRFNECSERARGTIEAEIRLVDWLDRQGTKVAAPIPSLNGMLVETVDTDLGPFNAVVFAGLEGAHRDMAECGQAQFRAWGAALGRLHATMKGYQDSSLRERPTWRDHLELARLYIRADEPALIAECNRLIDWASSLPTGGDDFGLIHFDFESDNLCWQDHEISVLDFDDCAHSWYVADIAYALRDLFADGVDLDHPLFQAFHAGYVEYHPITRALLAQIPMFLRLHHLYLFGRLSRALDLQADQEIPKWLQGLNTKLQGRVDAFRKSIQDQAIAE